MISAKDALIAYAKMMNTLNSSEFESMLADDFSYESQAVLSAINGKKEFIEYIRPKLQTIKNANAKVYAELAELSAYGQNECVVVAQGSKDNLAATVYIKINNDKITRLDMCLVPDPKTAKRSGIYPQ